MRSLHKQFKGGLLTGSGCRSQEVSLLVSMSSLSPFSVASASWLLLPWLVSVQICLFGTQGRSQKLESCLQETEAGGSLPRSPTGSLSALLPYCLYYWFWKQIGGKKNVTSKGAFIPSFMFTYVFPFILSCVWIYFTPWFSFISA